MKAQEPQIDVLIVGAGVSGLVAARELQNAGRSVLLLDKGRGLGGRLASRRMGEATFDHGAQFVTTRDTRFGAILQNASEAGVLTQWCQGFTPDAGGHTRWRGAPAMTGFAKYLARGLETRMEMQVLAVRCSGGTILSRPVLEMFTPLKQCCSRPQFHNLLRCWQKVKLHLMQPCDLNLKAFNTNAAWLLWLC